MARPLFCLLFFYYIFASCSLAVTPEALIERAEKEALSASTLTAEFSLAIHWQLRDTTEEKIGKIFLKKPGKYRIELGGNIIVADGETFSRYSPRNKQLVVNNIHDIEGDFQPGTWLFKYSDQYTALKMDTAVVSGERCFGITLSPKKEARFSKLKVWISGKSGLPGKIETTDKNDNTATYAISKITRDTRLDDKLFTLSPPKGTEVIDMRK
jgi:outer membrane lipoprotein-sorting protein